VFLAPAFGPGFQSELQWHAPLSGRSKTSKDFNQKLGFNHHFSNSLVYNPGELKTLTTDLGIPSFSLGAPISSYITDYITKIVQFCQ
jgi:hypothetical protein